MKFLSAPWRWDFICRPSKDDGCVFCRALAGDDRDALVCCRGEKFFVMLNKYPYSTGHLMIAPRAHLASPELMAAGDLQEMWELTKRALAILKQELPPRRLQYRHEHRQGGRRRGQGPFSPARRAPLAGRRQFHGHDRRHQGAVLRPGNGVRRHRAALSKNEVRLTTRPWKQSNHRGTHERDQSAERHAGHFRPEIQKWHFLENAIHAYYKKFLYQEIRTPIFEHSELFSRGIGSETEVVQKEMYTFTRQGGPQPDPAPREHRLGGAGGHREQPLRDHGPAALLLHRPHVPLRQAAEGPLPPVPAVRRRGLRRRFAAGRRRGHLFGRRFPEKTRHRRASSWT
ncbi:MAG: hypothetical protein M0C28_19305 [Candidatus Moduliflexus flocculans]|nr:hypothetical protein [Candidatus Moduliflexus flocculans]